MDGSEEYEWLGSAWSCLGFFSPEDYILSSKVAYGSCESWYPQWMCHSQFINTSRDAKQLGGQHRAGVGSLPTAPGHESSAQVHWDVYRRGILGLRRLLGGGKHLLPGGKAGCFLGSVSPCLLLTGTNCGRSWRGGWCGHLGPEALTAATKEIRPLMKSCNLFFDSWNTKISI